MMYLCLTCRAIERYETEAADKARYKKELRATKKIAKGALKRVAELETEIKEDKEKWKKEATDYKVEIHTLKHQLAQGFFFLFCGLCFLLCLLFCLAPAAGTAASGSSAPEEPRSTKVGERKRGFLFVKFFACRVLRFVVWSRTMLEDVLEAQTWQSISR